MKDLFHRILKTLNISGRDWAILLLALLLAFSIWLIHNLSLKYNDYLHVPVVAMCDIDGHSNVSANRCEVTARCRTTGYKVIRSSLKRGKSVNISFRHADMKHMDGDVFYVTSSDLQAYANMIFGSDVTVEYFLSDTLFFRFPEEQYKKVPVIPIYSITYKKQYMAGGGFEVEPDSVLVYGEPFRLETINAVYTKPVKYYEASQDLRGVVGLDGIKGVRISESDVRYSLDVKRFVEIRTMLPVKTVNVPSDKELLVYPSVVEVSLKCNFPLTDDPLQGLGIEADYNYLMKSVGGQCLLAPTGVSRGVISCDIEPLAVSCVIEDRRL